MGLPAKTVVVAGWRAGWPTCSVAPSALILSTYVCSSAVAASAVTSAVDWLVRRDTGLREPENLMSRCRAPYCVMVDLRRRAGA